MKISKTKIFQYLLEDFEDGRERKEIAEEVKRRRKKVMREKREAKKSDSKRRIHRIERAFRHGEFDQ